MPTEEAQLQRLHFKRVRRIKRLLRPLPRRSNVHKYPILKWFANTAREKVYLWSFRTRMVLRAILIGCIISFLPIYGIQIPLALILAIVLRANLPILIGLQFLTNPITVAPVYFVDFQIGRIFLTLFGLHTTELGIHEIKEILNSFFQGEWGDNIQYLFKVWLITTLGGTIVGTFIGILLSQAYRITLKRTEITYKRFIELRQKREMTQKKKTRSNKPKGPRLFTKYRPKGKKKKK